MRVTKRAALCTRERSRCPSTRCLHGGCASCRHFTRRTVARIPAAHADVQKSHRRFKAQVVACLQLRGSALVLRAAADVPAEQEHRAMLPAPRSLQTFESAATWQSAFGYGSKGRVVPAFTTIRLSFSHTHRTCFFPGEQASDHAPSKQPCCVQDCPPRLLRGFERGYQYFERRVPCAVPIQPSWCAGIQWPGACEPRSRCCPPGSAEPYGGGRGQDRRRIEGVAKLLAGCYRRWLRGHGTPPYCIAMFPRMAPGRTHFSWRAAATPKRGGPVRRGTRSTLWYWCQYQNAGSSVAACPCAMSSAPGNDDQRRPC